MEYYTALKTNYWVLESDRVTSNTLIKKKSKGAVYSEIPVM